MAKNNSIEKVTHVEIRMYRMGTGDCFVLKFFKGEQVSYKMMIDCGTWQGSKTKLSEYVEDIKSYVSDSIDLLVITHEHKDHVYVFESCKELFTEGFEVKKIWMAWTEDDTNKKVKEWKKSYGNKKKALALATQKLNNAFKSKEYKSQYEKEHNGMNILAARENFLNVLENFTELNLSVDKNKYVGMLEGMRVVKEEIADDNIEYFNPGEIVEGISGLEGVKFYILGPPLLWEDAKKETGPKGEIYDHNKELSETDAFTASILSINGDSQSCDILPFDQSYVTSDSNTIKKMYEDKDGHWRKIDYDWLNSAGTLALRINNITNNLSLAMAIEFEESGRVMLFPGDAEYGSWSSWHNIKWNQRSKEKGKHLTEDLLNRTVFYKVAHHLSHNGTAKRIGMEMMNHPDLVAMATLDYSVISSGWKSTMPNRPLIKELLKNTKGRLLIMNENDLYYDLNDKITLKSKIKEARRKMNARELLQFKNSYKETDLYIQYVIKA